MLKLIILLVAKVWLVWNVLMQKQSQKKEKNGEKDMRITNRTGECSPVKG